MKFRSSEKLWIRCGILVLSAVVFFAMTSQAKDSPVNQSIQYPVKRILKGFIMSVNVTDAKKGTAEINVSEKIYQISGKTVMVDHFENSTNISYFREGAWVYMVIDLYPDRREVLYLSPTNPPDETPEREDGKSHER